MHFTRLTLLLMAAALGLTACGLNEKLVHKIETVGSELTGVPVRVQRVDLGLFQGRGEVSRVTVANPEGYQAEYAFQMDVIRLDVGLLSFFSKPLLVEELVIDSPIVNFEQRVSGGSNWGEIAGNVRKNRDRADRLSKEGEVKTDDGAKKPVRIVVQKLAIQGVTFNWRRPDRTTATGTLPAVDLRDVGSPDGKTPGELGAVVALALAREMFVQVAAPRLREWVAGAELSLEKLEPERIRKGLEQKLTLSQEQWSRVMAVIDQTSQRLRKAFDDARARGFLDLDTLANRFTEALDQAREQSNEFLDREQTEKIASLLKVLIQSIVEEIRKALVDGLSRFLKLPREQVERLRPIFWEEFQQRSRLLGRLAKFPDLSLEEFNSQWGAISEETRRKVGEALDPDQVKLLEQRQDRLRHLVQEAYFGKTAP